MLAALAAATALGAAWGLGRSHQAPLGPFPGAKTHAAAGGSAGPSRPAQPEVSARRRGGRAGAAGEEAGLGHLSGRRLGLPSARRPLPSLSRGRAAGWAAGGAGGPGRSWGLGGRRGPGPSLPRGASQLLLPLSREAAALRLRDSRPSPRRGSGEPDGVPGAAETGDRAASVSPGPASGLG